MGYSPERINPGDKKHTVTKILKVTSGSTPEIGKYIDDIYKSIIVAGTYFRGQVTHPPLDRNLYELTRAVCLKTVHHHVFLRCLLGWEKLSLIEKRDRQVCKPIPFV